MALLGMINRESRILLVKILRDNENALVKHHNAPHFGEIADGIQTLGPVKSALDE